MSTDSAQAWQLKLAARVIERGGVVLHATEGVWGLACNPFNARAVRMILEWKGRPASKGLIVIAAEVPAGVFADAYSRKWSLVIAHVLMGIGMFSTGLVLSLPALLVTQMIWGLAWTFSSGADVAWITDELHAPDKTTAALISNRC